MEVGLQAMLVSARTPPAGSSLEQAGEHRASGTWPRPAQRLDDLA
jgi:hypothetical protein